MQQPVSTEWSFAAGVTYLNHGSFGPSPGVVRAERERWSRMLEEQPMEFLVRELDQHLDAAVRPLAELVGAKPGNLVLVDNATFAMNIVASSIRLEPDDEVLLTDHEYGAVQRIWRHHCERAGARLVTCELPWPIVSVEDVVETLAAAMTDRTRLVVVSHVTSNTATVFPVREICAAARKRGIPVCIDGPHAVAMRDINLKAIDCDFYAASCHKWLSAPFGSGFLFVHPRRQKQLQPALVSWGRSLSGRPLRWQDEFNWLGTRDPAAMLSIPAAIAFLRKHGFDAFREQTHRLARYARQRIEGLTGLPAVIPDSADWYGSMIALPLPQPAGWVPTAHGEPDALQRALVEQHGIEVPVFSWKSRRLLRVSCHLYNEESDIDRLVNALTEFLENEAS